MSASIKAPNPVKAMTMQDGKVISGIEWLNLNAYYDIISRINLPEFK